MIEDLTGAIEITQRIDAPPEIVFAYLTDSRRFVRWMGVGAELDPRPGGRYRIDVDGEHIASGEYQEVDPPHRLVMSWGWEGHPTVPPGSTTVEITLTPERGATVLHLRHLGLPDEGERRQHTEGWNLYASQLAEVAALDGNR
ncbi:MAG TPA: SRPBCC family protein [Candidatus Dormibacteraeota bacterium]|nr:SRPBCC family protein [Candidatus Dormibacteraeota bacterium]